MGEALWADLDQWQVACLTARLGPSSSYSTLLTNMVVAAVVRDYKEWNNADVWQFPAVIVSSARVSRPAAGVQSGDGIPHYRKTYPYTWLAVVEGDSFSSEVDAKVLEKRLETTARRLVGDGWGAGSSFALSPDSSGERLTAINVGDSNFARFKRASLGDSDAWFGVCSIDLDFIATV